MISHPQEMHSQAREIISQDRELSCSPRELSSQATEYTLLRRDGVFQGREAFLLTPQSRSLDSVNVASPVPGEILRAQEALPASIVAAIAPAPRRPLSAPRPRRRLRHDRPHDRRLGGQGSPGYGDRGPGRDPPPLGYRDHHEQGSRDRPGGRSPPRRSAALYGEDREEPHLAAGHPAVPAREGDPGPLRPQGTGAGGDR